MRRPSPLFVLDGWVAFSRCGPRLSAREEHTSPCHPKQCARKRAPYSPHTFKHSPAHQPCTSLRVIDEFVHRRAAPHARPRTSHTHSPTRVRRWSHEPTDVTAHALTRRIRPRPPPRQRRRCSTLPIASQLPRCRCGSSCTTHTPYTRPSSRPLHDQSPLTHPSAAGAAEETACDVCTASRSSNPNQRPVYACG